MMREEKEQYPLKFYKIKIIAILRNYTTAQINVQLIITELFV